MDHLTSRMRKMLRDAGFTPAEVAPLPDDLKGRTLVVRPNAFKKEHRAKAQLIWKATGGFGCTCGAIGRAVFAECARDGEKARFDRSDFCGEYTGEESP